VRLVPVARYRAPEPSRGGFEATCRLVVAQPPTHTRPPPLHGRRGASVGVETIGGQRDEGVAAERVVDDALHGVDLIGAVPLEPQREVRIRVRGAHEAPAAVGKQHARPVDVDRLVALLEVARQLGDERELLVVGAERLELGRGVQVLDRVEETRGRSRLPRDDVHNLAGRQQAVVHTVVTLGEEHVAADFAAEQDLVVAHLALEV
jgi:hypothetical protein